MAKKRIKRTVRKPTAAEKARYAKTLAEERQGMEANKALGRQLRDAKRTTAARKVLEELQALRESNEVSLSQLEERTGMTRGNLSRLWNNPEPNITIDTLQRIATALDRDIRIELVER